MLMSTDPSALHPGKAAHPLGMLLPFYCWLAGGLLLLLISSQVVAQDRDSAKGVPNDEQELLTDDAHPVESDTISEDDPEESLAYRTVKYSGKLHPIAVHFPIAFLLGAMLMQWTFVWTRREQIPPVVSTMLWFGTLGAIVAASLGWAYAYDSVYFGDDEGILTIHRWLGTSTAVASIAVLGLRRFFKPLIQATLLTLLAILVAAAGHFGASLLYGIGHLTEF